jgi:hypothetical protein
VPLASATSQGIRSRCRQSAYEAVLSGAFGSSLMLRLLRHPDSLLWLFFFTITATIVAHAGR